MFRHMLYVDIQFNETLSNGTLFVFLLKISKKFLPLSELIESNQISIDELTEHIDLIN